MSSKICTEVRTHRTILSRKCSALYTSLLLVYTPLPSPLYILPPVYLSESCTGPACGGSPSVSSTDHPSSLLSPQTRQDTSRHVTAYSSPRADIFVEGSARERKKKRYPCCNCACDCLRHNKPSAELLLPNAQPEEN